METVIFACPGLVVGPHASTRVDTVVELEAWIDRQLDWGTSPDLLLVGGQLDDDVSPMTPLQALERIFDYQLYPNTVYQEPASEEVSELLALTGYVVNSLGAWLYTSPDNQPRIPS